MINYTTLPILQEVEGVDNALQQNLSDLVYAVFYSDSSELVYAFRNGYMGAAINNACTTAVQAAVRKMEQNSNYVIRTVSILALTEIDDALQVDIEVLGAAGSLTQTITLDKATI
jgi:hypothetical protein